MDNASVKYKRTLRGSVGAGVSALFNGNGRRFYILEHKDASKYHKAGESQKIIIDQVEIGRDANCQVRFDESFPTVSRRHAAIVKEGDRWKLVQLSKVNTTLLNGRPVETEWYLENGDEIQISKGGPRLGFIVPEGKKSLVSSIKMTERFELFRQQALRPYKMAITCLSIVLVLSIGGLTTWNILEHNKWVKAEEDAIARADSLRYGLADANNKLIQNKAFSDSISQVYEARNRELQGQTLALGATIGSMTHRGGFSNTEAIAAAQKNVYYIRVEGIRIVTPDGEEMVITRDQKEYSHMFWTGTGFLLNDGRFVTARHVVDGTKFIKSTDDRIAITLNDLENSGGSVEYYFGAYAPGHSFAFTNKQCIVDRSRDEYGEIACDLDGDGENETYRLTIAEAGATDWAYVRTNFRGKLRPNAAASAHMKQQTKLTILGYPRGYYVDDVQSILGSCNVASDDLHEGVIVTTDRNFEHGNSGGPVFQTTSDGNLEMIGIISSGYGDTVGFIVPLCNLK